MLGIVFPGQGSQFRGMGEELFAKYPDVVSQADDVLGYSIKDLCLVDPQKQLNSTQYTQPALYVVNALFYREIIASGKKPDVLAGHSLGEYNALNAAGVIDFSTGLKLVKKRGEIMSQAKGGGMAAVLGITSQEIKNIMDNNGIVDIDIANFNSPLQTVISGPSKTIGAMEKYFTGEGVRYVPLNVSAPFHSRYMDKAAQEFAEFLKTFAFSNPTIPVISNVFARHFESAAEARESLPIQIKSAVRWCESMQYFIRNGGSKIVESGPGTVLSQMFEFIKKQSKKSDLEPVKTKETKSLHESRFTSSENTPLQVPMKSSALDSSSLPQQKTSVLETKTSVPERKIQEPLSAEKSASPVGKNPLPVSELMAKPPVHLAQTVEPEHLLPASALLMEEKKSRESKESEIASYLRKQLSSMTLGSKEFCDDYGVRYPYVVGGMQSGVSASRMLIKLGKAGLIGFLGTYGLPISHIKSELNAIKGNLKNAEPFGMNVVHQFDNPARDSELVDIALQAGVKVLEVANFFKVSEALIKFRFSGAKKNPGKDQLQNKIIAKVDRYEAAEIFMSPAPKEIVDQLRSQQKLTDEEADIALRNPIVDDICVVGNAAWRSDGDASFSLWPVIKMLRDEIYLRHGFNKKIRVGLAGGFGSPQTIATAFFLGADFIVTGSINQCTVEASTSDIAKDMLQEAGIKDFCYAPFYDMFEMGEKAQVLKRSVFFPHRANKLYQYYGQYNSPAEIDKKIMEELESRYFRSGIQDILAEHSEAQVGGTRTNLQQGKVELAVLFKWYLKTGFESALAGVAENKVNYQIFSGSALGVFNEYVKGTSLENWRNRYVDEIAVLLMRDAVQLLRDKIQNFLISSSSLPVSERFMEKNVSPTVSSSRSDIPVN